MRPFQWEAAARRAASALIVSLFTLSVSGAAQGAGLYFADRGVRPLGRGGAFIAGADDPGAIAYNPAGLFDAGGQVLLDGSWVNFSSEYTRQAIVRQVDPNTGETTATYLKTFEPRRIRTHWREGSPRPSGIRSFRWTGRCSRSSGSGRRIRPFRWCV
ncbi:MAG: hypothetical protein L6Q76_29720 [Polyangiaceae bacterium]|nr:hypothetical protein [Polyangiaceae bacterium]